MKNAGEQLDSLETGMYKALLDSMDYQDKMQFLCYQAALDLSRVYESPQEMVTGIRNTKARSAVKLPPQIINAMGRAFAVLGNAKEVGAAVEIFLANALTKGINQMMVDVQGKRRDWFTDITDRIQEITGNGRQDIQSKDNRGSEPAA